MSQPWFAFALVLVTQLVVYGQGAIISVSSTLPANTSGPPLEAFVSFSIEFAFFPDYAGTGILLITRISC